MLIAGAGGHAREILLVLERNGFEGDITFYDDTSKTPPPLLYDKWPLIHTPSEAQNYFSADPAFIIGVGNPVHRKAFAEKLSQLGGKPESIISADAVIGKHNCILKRGLNVMVHVFISNDTIIGEGCLINAGCLIHHNTKVGDYCELGPGAVLLGGSCTGDMCMIGARAVIMPGIKLGNNVIVAAGSIVRQDVPDGCMVAGVPAVIKNGI